MKKFLLIFVFMHSLCMGEMPCSKAIQIAVFCSGGNNIEPHLKAAAYSFGQYLRNNNFGLITGGGNSGLMKEVAEGYMTMAASLQRHQEVVLQAYVDDCHLELYKENIVVVETLHQRMEYFQSSADVFIALPGGFGTLHELIDCLVHNKHMNKPIILLNIDGFWNNLIQQFHVIVASNPAAGIKLANFIVVDTFLECTQFLKKLETVQNISNDRQMI